MTKIVYSNYNYTSDKIKVPFDNYRIVLISDLHSVELSSNNNALTEKIRQANPDIIIAAGDMVSDHGRRFDITKELFRQLIAICPVYYAPGNHEHKLNLNPVTIKKFSRYIKYIKSLGVKYLNNKSVKIGKDGAIIRISGLDIGSDYYSKIWSHILRKTVMTKDYISSLLKPCRENRLEILIAHNPDYFKYYAEYGADIVMAGHIHGGIMILPYIGGVISPTLRLFPYYDYGVFRHDNSTMYLTRGLGAHTIPLRINNPPEILTITLHARL